jgi:hypothetical protein
MRYLIGFFPILLVVGIAIGILGHRIGAELLTELFPEEPLTVPTPAGRGGDIP